MTSKDLHIAIKNGHGVQYVMERHHFENEETLFDAIRSITPVGAAAFINDLKKNQKKIDKKTKRNSQTDVNNQVPDEDDTETIDEDADLEIPVTLEELKEEEQELSDILCKLESQHKQMVAQRRDCMSRFERAKKALAELQRILRVQQENVTAIYEEYETLNFKMQDNNKDRAAYMELLESARSQIAVLKKVTVLVYKNGDIEIENAKIPSISEENLNIALTELISMPDAEEFTIKELKSIAKVRLIVEAIKQDNCDFELVFDSLKVQKFYETVIIA